MSLEIRQCLNKHNLWTIAIQFVTQYLVQPEVSLSLSLSLFLLFACLFICSLSIVGE